MKIATTLVFEFVLNPELDNDTRLLVALFLLNALSSTLFTATGKSAIYSLALASNNGADSMSCVLLFPSLWETALSPVIFGAVRKLDLINVVFLFQKASGTL